MRKHEYFLHYSNLIKDSGRNFFLSVNKVVWRQIRAANDLRSISAMARLLNGKERSA